MINFREVYPNSVTLLLISIKQEAQTIAKSRRSQPACSQKQENPKKSTPNTRQSQTV
jgi:hypothetical protein